MISLRLGPIESHAPHPVSIAIVRRRGKCHVGDIRGTLRNLLIHVGLLLCIIRVVLQLLTTFILTHSSCRYRSHDVGSQCLSRDRCTITLASYHRRMHRLNNADDHHCWIPYVRSCVDDQIYRSRRLGHALLLCTFFEQTESRDRFLTHIQVCSIIYNSLCITQSRYGLGLPISVRPVANLYKYSEVNFAGRPFYMAGITGFKVALCFAYLRITLNTKPVYRRIIWIIMVFTVLSHFGGTLVLFFQCTPMKLSWRPKSVPGSCLPNDITFYVLAAITIFCDCLIFALPIPLLAKVQINRRRKFGLIAVFSLGAFTTVCSVMRMVQISVIARSGDSTMLVLWGTIEMNVGVSVLAFT